MYHRLREKMIKTSNDTYEVWRSSPFLLFSQVVERIAKQRKVRDGRNKKWTRRRRRRRE